MAIAQTERLTWFLLRSEIMEKIICILNEIRPEFDFAGSNDFFEEGMLDSFDLVTLVATLDKTFNISIKGTKEALLAKAFKEHASSFGWSDKAK